jgi:hypothetical protein
MKRDWAYWACQIGGWGSQSAANLIFVRLFSPQLAGKFAVVYVFAALLGIVLTHLYRGLLRRRAWLDLPLPRSAAVICAASVVLAVIQTAGVTAAYGVAHIPGSFQGWVWLPAAISIWTVTFLLWNTIYAAVHYIRRTRRAEVEAFRFEITAKEAELRALHGQINPHFLFNSLNSLRALIHEDPARADRMVTELANVLRYALQSGKVRTVPLQAELDTVASYLALESIRFEERLRVKMEVADGLSAIAIPPMLMQMLVENAIKHGVEKQNQPGEIRVTVRPKGELVQLEVTNCGRVAASSAGNGLSLTNSRQRLRLLFGNDSRLELVEEGGQVTAMATWPAKEAVVAGADRR